MRFPSAAVAAMLAAVLSGCGAGGSAADAVTVRDSAGVMIVESPGALAERALDWTVSTTPAVRIGTVEGAPELQLFRVNGAAQLEDGTIVVVNAGTQEVRFYDRAGGHMRSVGGRGGGPGEYEFPRLVSAAHDSLLVADLASGRYTLLDAAGTVARTTPTRGFPGTAHGWLGGDRVLTSRNSARAGMDTPEGVMPNHTTFQVVDVASGDSAAVVELPGTRVFLANQGGQIAFTAVPFDPQPVAAVGGDAVYIAPGGAPEVRVFAADGTPTRVLRVQQPPRALPPAEFQRYVEERIDAVSSEEMKVELRRRYSRMPVPETVPAYSGLLVDELGYVWARNYDADARRASRWTVFDTAGAALGVIALPAGVQVQQIGADFVLATQRDELDVEYVVRFELTR